MNINTDHIKKVNKLSISSQSVITSSRIIYYKKTDITSEVLLEYDKYGNILYEFVESTITYLTKIANIDRY